MKLLVATGLFPPQIGGPATYSKLLCDEMPAQGVFVSIVNFGDVRHLPFGIRHFFYFFKLLRQGARHDLLYAQDTVSVGIAAALVSVLLQKPLWVRVPGHHEWEQAVGRFGVGATLDVYVTSSPKNLLLMCMRLGMRFVFSRAQRVVVPSQYMARVLTTMKVPESKIKVIYSSIQKPEVHERRDAVRARLGLQGPVIISAGRLVPWKGFMELIEVFVRLRDELPGASLVIVGDGPLMGILKEYARKLGVEESVRFTGVLAQSELFSYVQASDVFVLNTAYEGLSHLLIEVMMLGVPIVTTSVGGNTELITDGKEGLLVAYNDKAALALAVKKVVQDPALVARLAAGAAVRAQGFASNNSVRALCDEMRILGYLV